MKTLVTGATGFLGRHVLEFLVARGHEAIGTSRSPQGTLLQADVLVPESLPPVLEGQEAVIHCAGGVDHGTEAAAAMYEIHVRGTENLLAAAKAAGVRRFVHVSSSGTIAVSEQAEPILDEAAPSTLQIVRSWPYYRSKLFAEEAALAAAEADFEVVVLNPSLLLGPSAPRLTSVDLVARFLSGDIPVAPSGGLAFVDVRDAAAGIVTALETGKAGERYLLSNANMSFREFFERLSRLDTSSAPTWSLPKKAHKVLSFLPSALTDHLPKPEMLEEREIEMGAHYWYADASKARRELDWKPRDPGVTLDETVRDLQDRGLVRQGP